MRSYVLRAERKVFPSFETKLSPRTAVTFVAQSLFIALFASVDRFGFALAAALFCGFVYARQNILALAPVFIVCACVFALEWWTLLYAVCPVITLTLLYVLCFKLKRNVPLWGVALAALIGLTPFAVCRCVFYSDFFAVAISLLIVAVMSFCSSIAAYAVFVRKSFNKATVDELICGGILVCVSGYALCGVGGDGFYLISLAVGFTLLFSSACFKAQTTLFLSVLFGIGAALYHTNLTPLGAYVLFGAVAVAFSPFTKWSSAIAMLCVEAIFWLLNSYSGAGWQSLCLMGVGVVCCLCIPRRIIVKIQSIASSDGKRAYSGIVNRRSRELANRLYSASDVFFEMSKNMEKIVDEQNGYTSSRLAQEIAKNYCGKCSEREACFSALGEDTRTVLLPMADAALNRGKTSILDMPPFITGRCSKMHALTNVINSTAESYRKKSELSDAAQIGKRMMADQFAGIALVFDSLANDCSKPVNFANDSVESVKAELLKHNIVASEVVISGEGNQSQVTLVVRAQDAEKAILPRIVSKRLQTRLEVSSVSARGDRSIVFLESSPIYEVAYGIAEKIRSEENVSGDTKSVLCPSRCRRLFAICDGMGSGEDASKASRNAVSMIESFYRAGFDNDIILSLVNKLLKLSLEDSFTTLDISVVDTATGGLDVIKLGAAASFIVRRESVEVLSCQTPPAGILDSIQPITSRYQLFDGDMVLMMSDGVYDALESKGVAELVDTLDTSNPQTLADALLLKAVENGAQDDCTVMVLRIFCT